MAGSDGEVDALLRDRGACAQRERAEQRAAQADSYNRHATLLGTMRRPAR
jgi:hypothetical protein